MEKSALEYDQTEKIRKATMDLNMELSSLDNTIGRKNCKVLDNLDAENFNGLSNIEEEEDNKDRNEEEKGKNMDMNTQSAEDKVGEGSENNTVEGKDDDKSSSNSATESQHKCLKDFDKNWGRKFEYPENSGDNFGMTTQYQVSGR